MINRGEAEEAFSRLRRLALDNRPSEGSYFVERVDNAGTRFLAHSSDGTSALIVAVSGGPPMAPLRLEGLHVDYTVECELVEDGQRTALRASVIQNPSASANSDLFATLCASLVSVLPTDATVSDLAAELERWTRFFWRLSQSSSPELVGLAGELICIADAEDSDAWVRAWHARPNDRFDFRFVPEAGVVEVKTTSKDRRVHEVTLAQVDGAKDNSTFFASVRVVEGRHSLGELVREITDNLSDEGSVVSFWDVLTQTCGGALDRTLAFSIDYEVASESLRFYRMGAIPRPVVEMPLPSGVSNVRFSADFELCIPIERATVEIELQK